MNPLEESIIARGHSRMNDLEGNCLETTSLLDGPVNDSSNSSPPDYRASEARRQSSNSSSQSKSKKRPLLIIADEEPIEYQNRMQINVCGRRYEILESIIQKYPETLLDDPSKIQTFYDPRRDEYFFNRNRNRFDAILHYYQNGKAALLQFCNDEGFEREEPGTLPTNPLFRRIWGLVEIPQSFPAAKFFAILSTTIIVLSIFVFCIETLPYFQHKEEILIDQVSVNRTVELTDGSSVHELSPDEVKIARGYSQFQEPLFIIEAVCIAWFTIEFLTRLIVCPDKKSFLKSPMNIIDIIAIIPFYINLGITLANISSGSEQDRGMARSLAVLRILRLVRVFRIFKLSRHSKGLHILGKTFVTSATELGLLLLFLTIGVILFSSAAFYAEQVTTVGYGDIAPTGPLGKVVGTACAVSGLIAIALPVPVIVSNFNTIYQRDKDRPQVEEILNDALLVTEAQSNSEASSRIYTANITRRKPIQGSKD